MRPAASRIVWSYTWPYVSAVRKYWLCPSWVGLDDQKRHAISCHETGASMAQIMKPLVRQPCSVEQALKLVGHIVWVERPAD